MRNEQWPIISDTTQPMRYQLALSNGNRYALTAPTLIGRNPHPTAQDGPCNVILITDPQRTISKTHLLIGIDKAGPYVEDKHSTNGTIVTLPDGQQIICGPNQKVRIPALTTVFFGQFSVRIEVTQ